MVKSTELIAAANEIIMNKIYVIRGQKVEGDDRQRPCSAERSRNKKIKRSCK